MEDIELEESYLIIKKNEDQKKYDNELRELVINMCKKECLNEEEKQKINELFEIEFLKPDESINIYIFTACFYGCLCALRIFKEKGCDLRARDNKGLSLAQSQEWEDIVDFITYEC